MQSNNPSRLYCVHNVPSNVDCSMCRTNEVDYDNRPLYVPSTTLSKAVDHSKLNLSDTFYVPNKQNLNNRTGNAEKIAQIKSNQETIRVPRTSIMAQSIVTGPNMDPNRTLPGNFQNRAHRFTRSFSWKTKPEESPFAQMQPLPKLVKKPGLLEICLKSICWPTHQLCLCCARNTADNCRKWSRASDDDDCIDICWSSCALCSDDVFNIFNTPIVYKEKIIDPELLLPFDAELLYYSIQSAKRQKEKISEIPSSTKVSTEKTVVTENNQLFDLTKLDESRSTITPIIDEKKSHKIPQSDRNKKVRKRKSSRSSRKIKDKSKRRKSTQRRRRSTNRSKRKSKLSKTRSKTKSRRSRSKSRTKR